MGLLNSLFKAREARFVEVAPFGARYEVPGDETLLEAALRNGVPFPHNCTVGTCGSCKCKLKTGRVSALTDFGYTLSQQEIAAGFILACQAQPKDPLTQVEVEASAHDTHSVEKFVGKVKSRTPLTHDILKVTIELDRPMKFAAGQYGNLGFPNIRRMRNYSFSDAPDREGRKELNFIIRKVPKGLFTEDLFNGALDEVPLDVDGPHGNFHLHPGSGPMICIAGGSGLGPLLSILEDARKNRVKRPCAFLFGARTPRDLYCLDQIEQIGKGWADQFVFLPVLSHEPVGSDWKGARGLVTQFITDTLPDVNWAEAEGYMCGPPGMIDAGIDSMTEAGMSIEKIFYDKFTDESHIAKMP